MNLKFDRKLAQSYKNPSQIARILTENWASRELYCPQCGSSISEYENNRPVADFFCDKCKEEYELKSKKDALGRKIVDGAYSTMITRLDESNNPNFFFLNYDALDLKVKNLMVIPKHFFVTNIIEKRKPLPVTAKRAGWIGCNILLENIPQDGRIFYVKDGLARPREYVKKDWEKTLFLRDIKKNDSKGWILDIMNCIDRLKMRNFSLSDMYAFENSLAKKYPANKHIKDKIRQQLQVLRDKEYLEFVGRGKYQLTKAYENK